MCFAGSLQLFHKKQPSARESHFHPPAPLVICRRKCQGSWEISPEQGRAGSTVPWLCTGLRLGTVGEWLRECREDSLCSKEISETWDDIRPDSGGINLGCGDRFGGWGTGTESWGYSQMSSPEKFSMGNEATKSWNLPKHCPRFSLSVYECHTIKEKLIKLTTLKT